MGKIKRYKNIIEKFLSGEEGQRFFNFAYSIGAAVVILGALFKILHLPGGNAMLCIGMGTEVIMFVLTAFDRPEKPYKWENVFPVLTSQDPEDRPNFNSGGGVIINGGSSTGEVIISGEQAKRSAGIPENINLSESDTRSLSESIAKMAAASDQLARMAEMTEATQRYLDQIAGISEQMAQLRDNTQSLNEVSSLLLDSYRAITDNSETISRSSMGYVDQMESLNRNISGLNTIYEIQLKSISSQLENIDRVNRGLKDIRDMYEKSASESANYCNETERLAHNMKQLNSVYEKMVNALTVNLYRPMGGVNGNEEISAMEEYRRRTQKDDNA
ncbi:MAG: gliding motility protein GldL [Muribaculaceae bacterium]|nr:gliding motility protein GldL [Muribaculaceae bacterium]MEE1298557.1 gliding motility protein GldL [Muribaculaceae bacterium]